MSEAFPQAVDTCRHPIRLRAVERLAIRELVKGDNAFMLDAARVGQDIDRLARERGVQIDQFMSTLDAAQAAAFSALYVEEVLAQASVAAQAQAQTRRAGEADLRLAMQELAARRQRALMRAVTGVIVLCILAGLAAFWVTRR